MPDVLQPPSPPASEQGESVGRPAADPGLRRERQRAWPRRRPACCATAAQVPTTRRPCERRCSGGADGRSTLEPPKHDPLTQLFAQPSHAVSGHARVAATPPFTLPARTLPRAPPCRVPTLAARWLEGWVMPDVQHPPSHQPASRESRWAGQPRTRGCGASVKGPGRGGGLPAVPQRRRRRRRAAPASAAAPGEPMAGRPSSRRSMIPLTPALRPAGDGGGHASAARGHPFRAPSCGVTDLPKQHTCLLMPMRAFRLVDMEHNGSGHAHGHGQSDDGAKEMFEPESWEERYSGEEQVWSGNPNPQLVAEVSGLTPGTALDVGCGEGGDVIWLARRAGGSPAPTSQPTVWLAPLGMPRRRGSLTARTGGRSMPVPSRPAAGPSTW